MTAAASIPLHFRVGARSLLAVRRRLRRVPVSLAQALDGGAGVTLPALGRTDHGWLATSWPAARESELRRDGCIVFVRQRYSRRFADLTLGWDGYLTTFSGKSRSTLQRKRRKLSELSGGAIDCRRYQGAALVAEFQPLARALSEKTYQQRLLGSGLPDGLHPEAIGWLLFLDGCPVSYLYTPAEGDTLIYAHLGYDPAAADLSPGTVLQMEAMQALMAEARFRLFDFTEGDGPHKRLFSTGSVDCLDALVLRRTPGNLIVAGALAGFDRSIESIKALAGRLGLAERLRALTR